MKKCCLCRNNTIGDEPAILFIGQAGDEKEICPICEKNMDILQESENPGEINEAINYLYTCSLSSSDEEVTAFIKYIINTNSSVVEKLKSKRVKNEPVDMTKARDYSSDKQSESEHNNGGSFWISSMKVFLRIYFFGIIIVGIVCMVNVAEYSAGMGFLIFLALLILAFLNVAVLMVFLNMARDLSEIKSLLKNRRK